MRKTVALLSVVVTISVTSAVTAAPQLVNYQGILETGGNPVTTPTSVLFAIWSDSIIGDSLWSEMQAVTPDTDGRFNVLLGSIAPIPDSAFADDAWLSMKVGTDPEMSPRAQLVSVGYSYRVHTVDGASGGSITSKVSIGPGHSNTGLHAFIAGASNSATGNYAGVNSGQSSVASGDYSSVGGGGGNRATMYGSHVGGGGLNRAIGEYSTVAGGEFDTASGDHATVGGGELNTASGNWSTVGGGILNNSAGIGSGVATGAQNAVFGNYSFIGGGSSDTVLGVYNVIVGGSLNAIPVAAGSATIGGGSGNRILQSLAVISGGFENVASGSASTIPGGWGNLAAGTGSFAAGRFAKARGSGSMVIAANNSGLTTDTINTNNTEQMVFRADSGIYITNISEDAPANVGDLINTVTGAHLTIGGTWTNSSDKNKKENFTPVDRAELLEKIAALDISRWNYKSESDAVQHIGPTAQDFNALFDVGTDDRSISTIDPAGIALAAIQELAKLNKEQQQLINELMDRLEEMESTLRPKMKSD